MNEQIENTVSRIDTLINAKQSKSFLLIEDTGSIELLREIDAMLSKDPSFAGTFLVNNANTRKEDAQ